MTITTDEHFDDIVEALSATPGVTLGSGRRGFGSDALQVHGRIFAMARRGSLVLKLPAERVAELLVGTDATPFDAGKGRPIRQWVVLNPRNDKQWLALAREALAFVGATHPQPARGRR